jgi:hypothetical protein
MEPKGGGRIHIPIKPAEDSSPTYEASEDLSFQVSKLEDLIKGSVRMIDLVNLEKSIIHMENNMEKNMERIVKLIKN